MHTLSDARDFLVRKGLEGLVPVLTSSEDLLGKLLAPIEEVTIRKMKEMDTGKAHLWPMKESSARAFFRMVRRNIPRLNTQTKRKLAVNMMLNNFNLADKTRKAYREKYGEWPPSSIVISPTMRCGLRCFGCYSWKYDKSQELTREEVIDIIHQAKTEVGVHFFTITGGEPTGWKPLFEVCEHHGDCIFNIYTHGMNIDDEMADRFAEMGNMYPSISVEGNREMTDQRRGSGAYDKITAAMRRLYERGCLFGFSCTHTTLNDAWISDERFLDDMIERGCAYGWFFQYILTGKDPQPELVPDAWMRKRRYDFIQEMRKTKPILVYDFWNDGEITDGCIAWGKRYLHVTASGMVEPCVFLHMAKDNIREKRLVDIINSPLFKEARCMQPFNDDHRRPCCIIDNVDVLPFLVEKHGLKPTHPEAERLLTDLRPVIVEKAEQYARELAEMDVAR